MEWTFELPPIKMRIQCKTCREFQDYTKFVPYTSRSCIYCEVVNEVENRSGREKPNTKDLVYHSTDSKSINKVGGKEKFPSLPRRLGTVPAGQNNTSARNKLSYHKSEFVPTSAVNQPYPRPKAYLKTKSRHFSRWLLNRQLKYLLKSRESKVTTATKTQTRRKTDD